MKKSTKNKLAFIFLFLSTTIYPFAFEEYTLHCGNTKGSNDVANYGNYGSIHTGFSFLKIKNNTGYSLEVVTQSRTIRTLGETIGGYATEIKKEKLAPEETIILGTQSAYHYHFFYPGAQIILTRNVEDENFIFSRPIKTGQVNPFHIPCFKNESKTLNLLAHLSFYVDNQNKTYGWLLTIDYLDGTTQTASLENEMTAHAPKHDKRFASLAQAYGLDSY